MRELLGVAALLALGLAVSNRWFVRVRAGRFGRFLYLTGEEFLLLGLVLGPRVTGVLDHATLEGLEPFVGLGLGYLGFVFGLQFDIASLRQVPPRFFAASAGQSALVFAATAAGLWAVMGVGPEGLPLVAAVAAAGVGTSTSFLFLVDRHTALGRNPAFRFLRFSSVFDDVWGVALFGVALCWLAPGGPGRFLLTIGLSLVSAVVLLGGARVAQTEEAELPVLAGSVLFTGGVASYAGVSPILMNAAAGFLVANLHPRARALHERLLTVEKPIYFLMLLVAGAWWGLSGEWVATWTLVYVGARLVGKLLGGTAAGRILAGDWGGGAAGLGLLAQSEMSVALMVNLMVICPVQDVGGGAAAVLVGVIVNDLLSSAYYGWAYRKGA
ncbi:cation:proton antiporter [Deferrisoma palaeochoriense]